MPEKNEKKTGPIDLELSQSINEQLNNQAIQDADLDEIDPDELIKKVPLVSIAESLYHIERALKGITYIMNTQADSMLSYSREHFMAIFGGPDPELLQKKEIDRLRKLDAEHAKKQAEQAAKKSAKKSAKKAAEKAAEKNE